jgi:hypothetical protein
MTNTERRKDDAGYRTIAARLTGEKTTRALITVKIAKNQKVRG